MNTFKNRNSTDQEVVSRKHALHHLGHTVPDYMTGEDALQEANLLGWDVRKLDLRSTELSPEGVTEVGPMALMTRSPHLTTISIPSSLTTIEPGALCCPEVSGFVMPEGNPAYDIRSHSVVERATGRLVAGSTQSSPVDGSVSIIGEFAFYESLLGTIDLHEGVTQIEDRAFQYADFRTVICRAPTPPALGKDSFQVQKYNGKLKVPSQALDAYSQEWMKDENGSLGAAYLKWSIVALADDE